uniref:Uncharacterized protein n=1 Tax=Candidatus Kentrum sp. LPFa TaxID=2126335 RepID=A0A450W1M7_9GAMM|nr:MAG: hypothetical protein BECKLPF1236B_GA0070989_10186 [Candidatus Kentron sp. LPFa]
MHDCLATLEITFGIWQYRLRTDIQPLPLNSLPIDAKHRGRVGNRVGNYGAMPPIQVDPPRYRITVTALLASPSPALFTATTQNSSLFPRA